MIFGAGSQNENLRKASLKVADPTPKAKAVSKISAKISSSKQTSSITQSTIEQGSRQERNTGQSDPVRGSFEGLDNSSKAIIAPKGAGYDNKSFQTARYKEKNNFKPLNYGSNNFAKFKNTGKITRYGSITAQNSSAKKMDARLTIEKMFR